MIEPRIYRAAFLPAVLALVLVMFSLENRPGPVPQGLAADILFDGRFAQRELEAIVDRSPDRSPGSRDNLALARTVQDRFSQLGFETIRDGFEVENRSLVNVIGRRAGASRRQVVMMAARDSDGGSDPLGSAADTAALIELARVLEGRPTRKTLVLASVDGSTMGEAGARRFAETVADRDLIDAVLVLSDLGAPRPRDEPLVAWSDDDSRGSIGVQRTAATSLAEEVDPGDRAAEPGVVGQFVRLAAPLGIGAQGVLLERDIEAIRFAGSGEQPPPRAENRLANLDVQRYGDMGRGVLRTASALDVGRTPGHGPGSYVIAVRKVLPGWAISLLAITLLLPCLAASIDALARARRRKEPVGRWWRWVLAGALPFALGLAMAEALVLVGQAPDAFPAPPPPAQFPLDGAAWLSLGLVALTIAVAWLLLRRRPLRGGGRQVERRRAPASPLTPASPGAGCAVAVVLVLTALLVWLREPFAALLLVPAAHCWMLAMLGDAPVRPRTAAVLIALGILPWACVAAYYLAVLDLNPAEGVWYLFLLVTGHHVGLVSALLACVLLGSLLSTVAVLVARLREAPPAPPVERPSIRGPASYAGPGSLGGTESALRR